ncbi:MAG TPA: hypothetical protein VI540_07520, partial [Gaiellaceae bacterium]|nr:hypothetical protein [Gaiellaceae bacterium]
MGVVELDVPDERADFPPPPWSLEAPVVPGEPSRATAGHVGGGGVGLLGEVVRSSDGCDRLTVDAPEPRAPGRVEIDDAQVRVRRRMRDERDVA